MVNCGYLGDITNPLVIGAVYVDVNVYVAGAFPPHNNRNIRKLGGYRQEGACNACEVDKHAGWEKTNYGLLCKRVSAVRARIWVVVRRRGRRAHALRPIIGWGNTLLQYCVVLFESAIYAVNAVTVRPLSHFLVEGKLRPVNGLRSVLFRIPQGILVMLGESGHLRSLLVALALELRTVIPFRAILPGRS